MNELALAFTLGLGSAASPCLLPLYPGFIAYLAGNSRSIAGTRASGLLGLLVLLGVLSAMVVVGVVLGLLSRPVARRRGGPWPATPSGQSYVYGLMLGPLALPCAGPFLATLLLISVDAVEAAQGIVTFLVFGLGFWAPPGPPPPLA